MITVRNSAWALLIVTGGIGFACAAKEKESTSSTKSATKSAPKAAPAAGKSEKVKVDPKLPSYEPVEGISGRLKSVGSDTMNNLITLWTEDFKKLYPEAEIESEGKGSGTAVPALIQGTADLGPMSRDINPAEAAQFKTKFGYEPTQLKSAIDMVAVFVHKDNPIAGLSLDQLDAIFSVARKKGYEKEIRTWGDLGLEGEWANKPISLYGRDPASGTYVFFKEHVLEKGDYKPTVKQLPGSSAVVQGVAKDLYGIGYSGIGYKTADVRAVPISKNLKSEFVPAEAANAYSGKYPLSRFLMLSINYKPRSSLSPLNAEFIKFVFSKSGQEDVVKEGFLPVPSKVAEKALSSVGLSAGK